MEVKVKWINYLKKNGKKVKLFNTKFYNIQFKYYNTEVHYFLHNSFKTHIRYLHIGACSVVPIISS